MKSREHRGAASVWILVAVAAVCMMLGLAIAGNAAAGDGEVIQVGLVLGGLSLLAMLCGVVYEARRDLYAFCNVTTLLLIPFAIGGLEAAAEDGEGRVFSFGFAAFFGLAGIASAIYVYRARRRKDSLPDPLHEEFKAGEIVEQNGVQFAYQPKSGKLIAGEQLSIKVVAQNCFDAERTFVFSLAPEGRISLNKGKLEVASSVTLVLPPLACAQLNIPVRAEPIAKGGYSLLVGAATSGSGGARVRKPRAKSFSGKTSAWFFLLGHFAHLMNAVRARVRISVKAAPQLSFDGPPSTTALAPATQDFLYRSELAAAPIGMVDDLAANRTRARSPAPLAIGAMLMLLLATGFAFYKAGNHALDAKSDDATASGGVTGKAVDAQPDFSAGKELKIVRSKEPRAAGAKGPLTLHLLTQGLKQHGRPELEMIGVPETLLGPAEEFLDVLAESTVNEAELHAGESWGGTAYGVDFAVLVPASKDSKGVLRVSDFDDEKGERPARRLIASVAVKDAVGWYMEEKNKEAEAILRSAIAWYPGEPGRAEAQAQDGRNLNQNDNLAYLALAHGGVEVDRNYHAALSRSDALLLLEAGGALPPAVPREALLKDTASMITALQNKGLTPAPPLDLGDSKLNPDMTAALVPILDLEGEQLSQRIRLTGTLGLSYFYQGAARSRLGEPAAQALAAELYTKWQAEPARILELLREPIMDVYGGGFDFVSKREVRPAPVIAVAGKREELPMLSRIVAALGRELAAGETPEEIRARWNLGSDAKAKASAEKKLAALRSKE